MGGEANLKRAGARLMNAYLAVGQRAALETANGATSRTASHRHRMCHACVRAMQRQAASNVDHTTGGFMRRYTLMLLMLAFGTTAGCATVDPTQ